MVLSSVPKELSGFASLTRSNLAPYDTINSIIRCEDDSHLSYAFPPNAKDIFDLTVTGNKGMLYVLDEAMDGKNAWKVIAHLAEGEEEVWCPLLNSSMARTRTKASQKMPFSMLLSFKPRSRLKAIHSTSFDLPAVTESHFMRRTQFSVYDCRNRLSM
jgi:hypothetical protein